MNTLLTNEWLRADIQKPWKDRDVLCRFSDGYKQVCHYNGVYWASQDGLRLVETVAHHITHFYIYTKDTPKTSPKPSDPSHQSDPSDKSDKSKKTKTIKSQLP